MVCRCRCKGLTGVVLVLDAAVGDADGHERARHHKLVGGVEVPVLGGLGGIRGGYGLAVGLIILVQRCRQRGCQSCLKLVSRPERKSDGHTEPPLTCRWPAARPPRPRG